jgi:hypothetical protein
LNRVFAALMTGHPRVERYHFHIRCGDRVIFDTAGQLVPDLGAAAREAERIIRTLIERDQTIVADLDGWRLDVRGSDDVMVFTLRFSEVRLDQPEIDRVPPEQLPDTEALWSISAGHNL